MSEKRSISFRVTKTVLEACVFEGDMLVIEPGELDPILVVRFLTIDQLAELIFKQAVEGTGEPGRTLMRLRDRDERGSYGPEV